MRLAQSRTAAGTVVPLAGHGGNWFDLSPLTGSIGPDTLSGAALSEIGTAIDAGRLPETAAPARYAPPLAAIGKIVCIGLNYSITPRRPVLRRRPSRFSS